MTTASDPTILLLWEPNTHLRLVDRRGRPYDAEGKAPLEVTPMEGVSVGWLLELNGLKHYLERHRGRPRRLAWNRTVVEAPVATVWARLVSSNGILTDPNLMTLAPGERYRTTLSTGDRIEGVVVATVPNRGFQVTVEGWNHALYRLWIDRVGQQAAVNSWLSAYGTSEQLVKDFDRRMRAEIDRIASVATSPRGETDPLPAVA